MNFVGEQNRSASQPAPTFRFGDNFANARYTFSHRREGDELAVSVLRDHARDGRLAAARRTPKHHGSNRALLDRFAKRFARREQVSLAGNFVERAWTHARSER